VSASAVSVRSIARAWQSRRLVSKNELCPADRWRMIASAPATMLFTGKIVEWLSYMCIPLPVSDSLCWWCWAVANSMA
jgi:hypothetical protein